MKVETPYVDSSENRRRLFLGSFLTLVAAGMGWSGTGCLNAAAWLLRQPEDAVTDQELAGLYRSARR